MPKTRRIILLLTLPVLMLTIIALKPYWSDMYRIVAPTAYAEYEAEHAAAFKAGQSLRAAYNSPAVLDAMTKLQATSAALEQYEEDYAKGESNSDSAKGDEIVKKYSDAITVARAQLAIIDAETLALQQEFTKTSRKWLTHHTFLVVNDDSKFDELFKLVKDLDDIDEPVRLVREFTDWIVEEANTYASAGLAVGQEPTAEALAAGQIRAVIYLLRARVHETN